MLLATKTKIKTEPKEVSEFFETDYGSRKVSHINQSRMIAIPKLALKNACGTADHLTVNVSLVQKGKEKFLKLVPICETQKQTVEKKDE